MSEEKTEIPKVKRKRRSFIKIHELIAGIVFITICALLIATLVNKLTLKHDVTSAKAIASKTVVDIQHVNGRDAYALGSPKFKKAISADALTNQFKAIAVTTGKAPTLDGWIAANAPAGRTVYFIYKYTTLKVPFYIRIGVQQQDNHWYLVAVTGNVDESALTGN